MVKYFYEDSYIVLVETRPYFFKMKQEVPTIPA